MYVYIYDDFLSLKKYTSLTSNIETRVTDLGLNGRIIRISVMKNIYSAVENEIKNGAKTIIGVGNDALISQIVNAVIKIKAKYEIAVNIPIGIIPIGEENNEIAKTLGIKDSQTACDVISARRIEKIDLGKANNSYFISYARIPAQNTAIQMEKQYLIETENPGTIDIVNTRPIHKSEHSSNPYDGKLELIITTQTSRGFLKKEISKSVFQIKNITIFNPKEKLILDNALILTTPVEISVLEKQLNIIVGKERNF